MSNEINLFGPIGRTDDGTGITAQQVKTFLASADQTQPLVVRIDSEGGSVFDGLSIYDAFKAYPGPKKAIVESTAFSIASYIACAFEEVEIAENGYFMIHEPKMVADGTQSELRGGAELLAKLDQSMVEAYCRKTGLSEVETRSLMKAETFFNASEALTYGLASSVGSVQVQTRIAPQAKHRDMPQRVYAALFGAGSGDGVKHDKHKEQPVANQKPTAATVKEIKAAFPKMKAEFVVRCMEEELPLEDVAAKAAEELMAENEQLMAKCTAMEEEITALRAAKAMEEETPAAEETIIEVEEEEAPAAKAKATASVGVKPVARAAGTVRAKSATALWTSAVDACLPKCGGNKVKAAAMANKQNPGLRQRMVAEANS